MFFNIKDINLFNNDELEKLIYHEDINVRVCLALNPFNTCKIFDKLSKDKDILVIKALILNQNCPSHILEKFVNNENVIIRVLLARNNNCSIDILEKLVDDLDWEVRQTVAFNEKCSINLLEKIIEKEKNFYNIAFEASCFCKDEVIRRNIYIATLNVLKKKDIIANIEDYKTMRTIELDKFFKNKK